MFDENNKNLNEITDSNNPEEINDNEDKSENKFNENDFGENINNLLPKILEKAVEILNDTGNKIQFFKKTLHQIDESLKPHSQSNKIETEKENDIDLKKVIDKKTINDLLKKEKEIFCNLVFLNKIFPTYTNIPEKIFNTRAFLEICFIDLVNSHMSILDMDISGQLILIQYERYENKPIEFLISKKKYIIPLLKLSITMLDNSLISKGKADVINLNEKLDNNDNIFDLKKYVKNLLNFIDKMINNNQLFDENFKLSIMPGLISKITKLIQSNIKITSKMISNICSIQIKYINILFNYKDDKNKDNFINKKKFCEFYEVFLFILFDKYKNKIIETLLDTIIEMNTLYLKNIQNEYKNKTNKTDLISRQFFENIFYIINNQIFDNVNKSIQNNNAIFEKLDNFKSYDNFYITYINHYLFNIENKTEKTSQLINRIENAYLKKEFLKFNRNLIELMGTIKLIIHYYQIKSINNFNDLFSNLLFIFSKIIQLNKNKIFLEVINSYEFIFLNINQIICKENIISDFFKTVINTYNNEYNLHLLFIFLSHLYKICPELYSYFFEHCLNEVISSTKNFNSKLLKKKFTTFTQLNDCVNELINSFIMMEFLILFQKEKKILSKKETNKIISLIHFYYDLFIDTENEESFSRAKINNIKLSLINLFLMNISVFTIERSDNFIIEEKNILILLSMFNYSNNAKIMKYSASLLILNINKDKDLKNFIKTNYTFLINTILNKIIYFNINNNTNKSLVNNNNCQHMKSVILCVFSSLIELINNFYYDDEINKIFVVEFYNYTQKLFPYLDNNIKDKNIQSIDIMLEIFIKISIFQNNVLSNECKKNSIDLSILDIDTIRMASEEFFDEKNKKNKLIQSLKVLKEKLKLQKCNICRKLILRFIPLILSKKITFVSKCLQIIKNYLLMLFLLPMEKEEDENFSEEDPSNVIISSSLGPIMYELWKPLVFAFNSKSTTLAGFTMFFEIFNEISNFHPEFFDSDKIFGDLIPCLGEKLNSFSQEYKEIQIYNCVNNYVLVFLKKVFKHNKYNKKYTEEFKKFIDDNKKYFMIGIDEDKKEVINREFNKMMLSFTKI